MAKIIGTSRDDTIAGTNSHDKIFGLNGNDRIWAGGGNDFVSGGNGKDEIRGEDGCDVLLGGNGKDKLFGGAHSDLLFGGNGNDILDGGEGSDFVSGGRGNDTGIFRPDGSGHGYDIYDGGKGRDTLVLEVTREQANSAQFIAELKAYEEFIESNSGHHGFWEPFFVFNSIGLKARNWEKLEVVVIDDPAPLAQVSVSDAETTEGDDLVFTVSLDGPAAADVTVDYEIVLDGSASAADLAAGLVLTGTVTIAAGATSADIVAGTFDDALFEGTEDLRLELSNPSANAAIADGDGAGTILDNDPAPLAQVSVSDAETTEGDDLVFTVSLDGPAAADVTVDYEIVLDGSASAADLAAGLVLTGTVTIAAGATSADIVAGTFDDALFEGTEDLRLELSNPSANAAIADGDGAGTILDNDPAPLAQVSVSDAETTEGDDLVFTVSLDGPAAADVTVDYEIVLDGSASAADLAAGLVLTGTVTIAAGATSADIVAGTFDDALFEGTEDLRLELSNPSANAAIADGDGAGTILDNDPAPLAQVSVSDAETTEGDDLVFTVSLDGPAAADVTVDYEIVLDGSASAADLAAGLVLTGTVTIAAGATSADIVAGTFDDALFEGTEDLRLELSNPSANAAIADGDGAGTILDNDPAPLAQVSVSDAQATEGDDLVFTVSLDGPAAADVTVDYEIVLDGSASAADLAAGLVLTGTVTIAAGATSADIVAGTFDDALFEGTEDLRLELSNPSANAAIADGDGAGTILDNDPAPLAQVSVSDAETTEGDDLVFTVSLDGPAAADVTVDYEIVLDGSASAADLAAGLVLTGTVTIAAGATSADIVAGTFDDALFEGTEDLRLELSNPSANAAIADGDGAGTILDTQPESLIVFQNGGQANAEVLTVGTTSAVASTNTWTGATLSDMWSQPGNWSNLAVPVATDRLLFDLAGAGTTILDSAFTIDELNYSSQASYTLDMAGANTVTSDSITIGQFSPNDQGTLIVRDGTSISATGLVQVGYNSGSGIATGNMLIQTNAELGIATNGALRIGYVTGGGNSSTAGASGTLVLGSESALTLDGAELAIGYNARFNGSGTATGLFDASDDGAEVNLNLTNLLVGAGGSGAPSGTFRWNQSEAILANLVSFSDSGNSVGVLDTRSGETVTFGTAADAIGEFRIGYNGGAATTVGEIDLSVENPFFTAFIDGALRIGYVTGGGNSSTAGASGTLVLGSESALTLDGAELAIGYNARFNGSGTATGLFDASDDGAEVNLNLTNLLVGAGGSGAPSGTFRWNQSEAILANLVSFSDSGNSVGVLDTRSGETVTFGTAADAIGEFRIGYNGGAATTVGEIDLSVENPFFTAFIDGALRIGYVTGGGNSSTAGASGTLVLGSESALTLDGAELAIGYNARFNGSGTATGLFDASDDGAEVNLNLTNLLVGAGGSGAPSGTFRWNQSEAILANLVSFSDSGNSVGVLDTRSGETVTFGTAADAIGEFRIGYNGGAATTVGEIDLSVENPFFTAFIDGALRIGYVTGGGNSSTAGASGTLVLGSESALTLDGAELAIGYNARFNGSGTATGLFDASDDGAEVNLNLTNLLVGAGGSGAPSGTFRWNQSEAILANLVSFSDSGNSVGVLDTRSGETVTFGTAADAIGEFRIGYNGGAATTVGEIDLSVENPFFTAFIDGALRIGYVTGGGNSSTAGASGTLVLGSESALTLDGAELAIGYNARFNGSGTATGLFDASDDGAEVNLNLTNLLVGAGGSGAPSGTFRWNQSEAILANLVSFSDSGNSVGVLDTRSGETVTFGTAADAIGEFRIGYNGGAATTVGEIDLSVENPFFTAFIDGALRIGYVTGGGNSSTAGASGTLVLGSESALTLDGAELAIGYNARFNGSGTATGLFDASDDGAEVNLNLTNLLVGAGGSGFTEGTFLIGGGTSLAAITTNVGIGTNSTGIINFFDQTLNVGAVGTLHTETLNFDGGLITGEHLIIDAATGSFSYTDGNLAVNVIDGDLVQQGGFLEAGRGVGQTIINGNYEVESAGGVSIEIDGTTAVSGHDVLSVNGTVSLNADASSGAALDIDLGFAANLGDTFLFFENDGVDLVSGAFDGLAQGGTTTADFGTNRYTFEIDYLAGDGNDVALEIVDIFLL